MREFFKGWRRKLGCVALVTSVVLFAIWIRSLCTVDIVEFSSPAISFDVVSGAGRMVVLGGDLKVGGVSMGNPTSIEIIGRGPLSDYERVSFNWMCPNHNAFVLYTGRKEVIDDPNPVVLDFPRTPYWRITLGPTLLSAYLLLWKPRSKAMEQTNA